MKSISNKKSSTGQILKASAIMGVSSAFSMIASIIRTKVLAILLGPEGIGLLGLLQSILNTAGSITGMGLANSGVRQVAEAQAHGDAVYLSRTRSTLWWVSLMLGLLGAVLLVTIRKPIARLALGTDSYAGTIAWLAVGVWATTVSGAQTAILNGLCRLGDLAKVNILGALGGTLLAVLSVWLWGKAGIVIVVVSIPLTILVTSWWFTIRIPTIHVNFSWQTISKPFSRTFQFGLCPHGYNSYDIRHPLSCTGLSHENTGYNRYRPFPGRVEHLHALSGFYP